MNVSTKQPLRAVYAANRQNMTHFTTYCSIQLKFTTPKPESNPISLDLVEKLRLMQNS